MAWEKRRGGRLYLYRSRRTAEGKVVKDYLGRGGEAAAVSVNAPSAAAKAAWRQEQAKFDEADDHVRQLEHASDVLLAARLLVNGYHRHNYGPWRKRRGEAS